MLLNVFSLIQKTLISKSKAMGNPIILKTADLHSNYYPILPFLSQKP